MDREWISEKELVKKINREFSTNTETAECSITSVFVLPDCDVGECNWSIDFIKTGGTAKGLFSEKADKIITEFQQLYNVTSLEKK